MQPGIRLHGWRAVADALSRRVVFACQLYQLFGVLRAARILLPARLFDELWARLLDGRILRGRRNVERRVLSSDGVLRRRACSAAFLLLAGELVCWRRYHINRQWR